MNFFRKTLWGIAALSVLTACGSFVSQYVLGMNPCVLCILQRLSVLAVGLAALAAAFFRQSSGFGRTVCALAVSIRQLRGAGLSAGGAAADMECAVFLLCAAAGLVRLV